jgi:dienelactone hydrolase
MLTFSREGTSITVAAYLPDAPGPRPVVIFSSGLQQQGSAYRAYAERLASHGVITTLRNDPGFARDGATVGADVAYMITDWLPAEHARAGGKLEGRVDLSRVGLAGHSKGGQASIFAATGAAKGKVKALFGIDPVDGGAPGSTVKARTQLPGSSLVTGFLGETTNATGTFGQACAPKDDNYQAIYELAPSPSLEITAVGADHVSFQDPDQCTACFVCMPRGTADPKTVYADAVRYTTAFFARELLGDAALGPTLAGAGLPADEAAGRITLRHK